MISHSSQGCAHHRPRCRGHDQLGEVRRDVVRRDAAAFRRLPTLAVATPHEPSVTSAALEAATGRIDALNLQQASLRVELMALDAAELPGNPLLGWFEERKRDGKLADAKSRLATACKEAASAYSDLPGLRAAAAQEGAELDAALEQLEAQLETKEREVAAERHLSRSSESRAPLLGQS